MQIIVLGLRGFPGVEGGVENHAENLYPLLAEMGRDVEVIVRSNHASNMITWRGVRFRKLWAPRRHGLEAFIHSLIGVFYAAIRRPDILHIHAIGPAIVTPIARLLGLRVVVTHHGPDYDRDKWGRFPRFVLKTGERWGMKFSNDRISISKTIHNLIKDKYKKSSLVIPNGVVVHQCLAGGELLERFGIIGGRYILNVGRFVPEKRQLDLINAFNSLDVQGYKLVFVGNLPENESYVKAVLQASKNNSNIVFTGYQSGDDLYALYSNARMFILPSSHEGLPIVLLEAMSFGIPVLASDIPANREINLPEENYFHVGNINELRKAIARILGNEVDRMWRERQIQMIKEEYSWPKIAGKTLEVYRDVIS